MAVAVAVATVTVQETAQDYTWNLTATVFNVGPLTTTFTPPTPCAASDIGDWLLVDNTNASKPSHYYDYNNMITITTGGEVAAVDDYAANTDCMPSGDLASSVWMHNTHGVVLHSPGLYCPTGWATSGFVTHLPNESSIAVSGIATPAISLMTSVAPTGATHVLCCPR